MPVDDDAKVIRELRRRLPAHVFRPVPLRLLWLPFHVTVILASWLLALSLSTAGASLWPLLLLSPCIGMSFAGLAFLAHETLHGATCRRAWLRRLIGLLAFFPFAVAPRLWSAWHNRVHHGNTNVPGRDPDAYPTLKEYSSRWWVRWAILLGAPRGGRLRGILTLLLGFSLQSLQLLVSAPRLGLLGKRHFRIALAQSLASFVLVGLWAAHSGWLVFCLTYLLPLFVGNAVVMMHIVTNHSLSPHVHSRDTLSSSLSVNTNPVFSELTLGFGYHVEHHLFPSMSHRYGALVQKELRKLYPEKYQELPLLRALFLVFTTPRVYSKDNELYCPVDGQRAQTLGPHSSKVERSSEEGRQHLSSRAKAEVSRLATLQTQSSPSPDPPH